MCGFFDGFDQGDFMNEDDSFEDNLEEDIDDPGAGDCESDDESAGAENQEDDLNAIDPFIIGGVFGFGYELTLIIS